MVLLWVTCFSEVGVNSENKERNLVIKIRKDYMSIKGIRRILVSFLFDLSKSLNCLFFIMLNLAPKY